MIKRDEKQNNNQLDRKFFQDDGHTQKKQPKNKIFKKITNKVKARDFLKHFLQSIQATKDFQNNAFVIGVYSFLLKNSNPLMNDRKLDSKNNENYIKMLWQKRLPHKICYYVYLKDNYLALTQLRITFQRANVIIKI